MWNKNGDTPLLAAYKSSIETLVKYLIENGAEINKENEKGDTPLIIATKNKNETIVNYLIENRANLNKKRKLDN